METATGLAQTYRLIYIDCLDCLTPRSLFERILNELSSLKDHAFDLVEASDGSHVMVFGESHQQADSLDAFAYKLDQLPSLHTPPAGRGVLMLDHFSHRWSPNTAGLVAALHDAFNHASTAGSTWTAVYVSDDMQDIPLTLSIPVVHVPAYTADDVLAIIRQDEDFVPLIVLKDDDDDDDDDFDIDDDNERDTPAELLTRDETNTLYARFAKLLCSAYWDRLGPSALPLYRRLARRLWPIYIEPVMTRRVGKSNHVQLGKIAGARGLWQDEAWLLEMSGVGHAKPNPGPMIGLNWSYASEVAVNGGAPSSTSTRRFAPSAGDVQRIVRESEALDEHDGQKRRVLSQQSRDRTAELSVSAKYLLIASYLASYNPPRLDRTLYSHGKGADGEGLTRRGTPRKRRAGKTRGPAGRVTAAGEDRVSQRLLGPKGFVLERMLGIYHAILTTSSSASLSTSGGSARHTVQLDQQIATLATLRLLWKGNGTATEAGATGGGKLDYLDDGRWTCAISFDVALRLAHDVGFELQRYLSD